MSTGENAELAFKTNVMVCQVSVVCVCVSTVLHMLY